MVGNWIVLQRDRNELEKEGKNKSGITRTKVGTNHLWEDGAGWQKPLAQQRRAAGNSCRVQTRGQLVLARVTMPASACRDLDRASHGR